MGMLAEVPNIETPKRAKKAKMMKGRSITTEEFERMLTAVPDSLAVTKFHNKGNPKSKRSWSDRRRQQHDEAARQRAAVAAPSWRYSLAGLWWSGSAHDLRRSFGERWSARVLPPLLMALMRHENIETTLRYYVGRNAQSLTQAVWDGYRQTATGSTSGNSHPQAERRSRGIPSWSQDSTFRGSGFLGGLGGICGSHQDCRRLRPIT